MFEVVKINGCFRLTANETYVKIFSIAPQKFIKEEIIGRINYLSESIGKGCPNEEDAKMVIY